MAPAKLLTNSYLKRKRNKLKTVKPIFEKNPRDIPFGSKCADTSSSSPKVRLINLRWINTLAILFARVETILLLAS